MVFYIGEVRSSCRATERANGQMIGIRQTNPDPG